MTGNKGVTDLTGQVMGRWLLRISGCRWGSGQRNPRVLIYWPSTSGVVGVSVQLSLGLLVSGE